LKGVAYIGNRRPAKRASMHVVASARVILSPIMLDKLIFKRIIG